MEMRCHQGVYVRAIARDLGRKLGCHAHIVQLRRLTVGPLGAKDMMISDSISDFILDKEKKIRHSEIASDLHELNALLLPLEIALEGLPKIKISPDQAERLRCGQAIFFEQDEDVSAQPVLAIVQTKAVALCRLKENQLAPERVFNSLPLVSCP